MRKEEHRTKNKEQRKCCGVSVVAVVIPANTARVKVAMLADHRPSRGSIAYQVMKKTTNECANPLAIQLQKATEVKPEL